jgi:Aspartyl protease
MKFAYKEFGPGVIRPVIPIQVSYGGRTVKYNVLVDSGADMCLFDAQIGELLGIPVAQGERMMVTGVTANPQAYYKHHVVITVGGWDYKIEAGLMPNFPSSQYGIVGQVGFFELFTIKFDYQKEQIEIKPKS